MYDSIKKEWRGPFRVELRRDMFGESWVIRGMALCQDGQYRECKLAESGSREISVMIAELVTKALQNNGDHISATPASTRGSIERCPRDTNGDGDCGQTFCPVCNPVPAEYLVGGKVANGSEPVVTAVPSGSFWPYPSEGELRDAAKSYFGAKGDWNPVKHSSPAIHLCPEPAAESFNGMLGAVEEVSLAGGKIIGGSMYLSDKEVNRVATSTCSDPQKLDIKAAAAKMEEVQERYHAGLRESFTGVPCSIDYSGDTTHPDGYRIVVGHRLAKKLGIKP